MRDLAFVAALLGVLAGIVHLATRTKRLPPHEPADDDIQPLDPRLVDIWRHDIPDPAHGPTGRDERPAGTPGPG